MFHFSNTYLNLFNVSSLFSGGIIISSTGSCFTILLSSKLVAVSAILFLKNSPALWTTFLEVVNIESCPASNNCFLYFLANVKNP